MALSGWSIKHKTKGTEVTQAEYESANSHDVDAAPEGDTGTASTVAGDTGSQGDTGTQEVTLFTDTWKYRTE